MADTKKKKEDKKNPKGKGKLSKRHDKYDLYQQSVQEPEADISFFHRIFRREFGERPHRLREDFCGTAYLSCTWVRGHPKNTALGVDLDPEPLRWGLEHNAHRLKAAERERLTLRKGNALDFVEPTADVIAALNFSYFTFKAREDLLAYFRATFRNLSSPGLLVTDLEGGTEAIEIHEEIRDINGFTYVWDQDRFDPITHNALCYIHFRFPDESRMKRAFSYDWRIWTLPEVRELMLEAGFRRADVYWEGTDKKTEEGNGVFTRREHAENCESWICYVVGIKE